MFRLRAYVGPRPEPCNPKARHPKTVKPQCTSRLAGSGGSSWHALKLALRTLAVFPRLRDKGFEVEVEAVSGVIVQVLLILFCLHVHSDLKSKQGLVLSSERRVTKCRGIRIFGLSSRGSRSV